MNLPRVIYHIEFGYEKHVIEEPEEWLCKNCGEKCGYGTVHTKTINRKHAIVFEYDVVGEGPETWIARVNMEDFSGNTHLNEISKESCYLTRSAAQQEADRINAIEAE
jgi:hypothetical protein